MKSGMGEKSFQLENLTDGGNDHNKRDRTSAIRYDPFKTNSSHVLASGNKMIPDLSNRNLSEKQTDIEGRQETTNLEKVSEMTSKTFQPFHTVASLFGNSAGPAHAATQLVTDSVSAKH